MSFLILITMVEAFLRGHSIVWKNKYGTTVKQVVYHQNDIFGARKEGELNKLIKLPYGYRYDLYRIQDVNEIQYNKTCIQVP